MPEELGSSPQWVWMSVEIYQGFGVSEILGNFRGNFDGVFVDYTKEFLITTSVVPGLVQRSNGR